MIYALRCKCQDGYTGVQCDVLIDKCYSNPCQNAGTCTLSGTGYMCSCQYPWQGVNCELNQDLCFINPCLHYGTCYLDSSVQAGYTCSCAEGFIGGLLNMCDIMFINIMSILWKECLSLKLCKLDIEAVETFFGWKNCTF